MKRGKKPRLKKVAEAEIRKNRKLPSRTIAKILAKKYPDMFKSIESARNIIRYIRGAHGERNMRDAVKDLVRTKSEIDSWKQFLPKPVSQEFKVHSIGESLRYLVLADIHAPYHEYSAVASAIQMGVEQKCNGVIYLGDAVDFYMASRFVKDPRARDLQYEIDTLGSIFEAVHRAIKPKKTIWKLGNHEARLEKYLKVNAPALIQLRKLKTASLFEAEKRGIEIIPANNPLKFKGLVLIHGDEFGGGYFAPVNPARGVFIRAYDCVVMGHRHVTSEHTETTVNGKVITCWSVGCLCNLHPEYSPLNKWNHGFGILEGSHDEFWRFKNYRIVKGEIV